MKQMNSVDKFFLEHGRPYMDYPDSWTSCRGSSTDLVKVLKILGVFVY